MTEKQDGGRRTAWVQTGCQGGFDQGFDAGVEWAQNEIARFLISGEVTYADYAAVKVRDGDWNR